MTGVAATLQATFDCASRARVRTSGPLELRGPLRRASDTIYYLRNITAGIFAGDSYETHISAGPGARVCVESSSAAKVYTMPEGYARSSVQLSAERGSTIVWGPHATLLHTGSALRQETRVTLEPGARVLLAESLVCGRIAAGECFDFRRYDADFHVEAGNGELRFREAISLEPDADLRSAMAERPVLTCVYALGVSPTIDSTCLAQLTAATTLAGWSELPNDCGIVLKHLGASLSEGQAFARACLNTLDPGHQA